MFKNRSNDGLNNLCGKNIAYLRKSNKTRMSQRMLAEQLQLRGIDVDKNAVQRIEAGKRFVTDIELMAFVEIFNVSYDELLKP